MSGLTLILVGAAVMAGIVVVAILAWLLYTSYLTRLERRLAARKGLYRELVAGLATRERDLLAPILHQRDTLEDFEALEAVLEEQARGATGRPAWLLDAYDRLGLVDKYVERLRTARQWRERAFAAELLGRVGSAKAVGVLIETVQATRTEDADVREIALRALARIADPRAVAPLVRALRGAEVWLAPRIADILARHGELAVDPLLAFLDEPGRHSARPWAASVLGEVRPPRAFAVLARGLDDVEDEMRAKCATALGRLGDRRALTYLLDHLLSDPAPFVRARIAGALGQFNDPEVIDRLVRALGDPAWWVRMRSVEALEQIGAVAEGPLLVALDDPDPEIRMRAAVSLERLGMPARIVAMLEQSDRPAEASEVLVKFAVAGARELLAELLLHPASAVRLAVVEAIRHAGRRDLTPELIQAATGDRDPSIRGLAFDTLRALGLKEAVPAALDGTADADDGVRAAAIHLAGDLGDADAVPAVRERTRDPAPSVRIAAARALGVLRAGAATGDLRRLLADPQPGVREAAALAAADGGFRDLGPALVDLLADSEDGVRRAAARGLGVLDDRGVVPALVRSFRDADLPLRETIADAVAQLDVAAVIGLLDLLHERRDPAGLVAVVGTLARHPSRDAGRLLEQVRQDPDPAVRAATVDAFGRVGGADAAQAVRTALRDPDEAVRARAVDAVARLQLAEEGAALVELLAHDPAATVRERAALAIGLLRIGGGEEALVAACRRAEPTPVHAAAALAIGAYDQESIVARVVEMTDAGPVRELLRERLRSDAEFRLLGMRLGRSRHVELRALAALTPTDVAAGLADGMRSTLDPLERIRLVGGLRAFHGERSRSVLLQVVRSDPSPDVRAAALTAVAPMLQEEEELLGVAQRALADPSLVVRRTAVGLFSGIPPEQGLPSLMQTLRADDDPAVLAAVAELAEGAFDAFVNLSQRLALAGGEAVMLCRVARYVHHPELGRLLPPMARSESPQVREALAALWRHRPDLVHPASLEALAVDPVPSVRRLAARAAAEVRAVELLVTMGDDPDADVRAAAYVAGLATGRAAPLPAGVPRAAAVEAARAAADLASLRETALTAPAADRRLAAALLLALLDDPAARDIAARDPIASVRSQVAAALDGAEPAR